MDISTLLIGDIVIFAAGLIVGFVVGKLGFTKIEQDITFIKGLISGQQKVAVVSATQGAVVAPVSSTVGGQA